MGPWVLAQLMAHLFLASPGLAHQPVAEAARSLEDLVRASDLIVLGRPAADEGPGASVRLIVDEILLGGAAPGESLDLAEPVDRTAGDPPCGAVWFLAHGFDGRFHSLEAAPRHSGWRDEVRSLLEITGLRLVPLELSTAVGDPALIELSLRNTSDQARSFPIRRQADGLFDAASLDLHIDRLTSSGPVAAQRRPLMAEIDASAGVTLEPGEAMSVVIDIGEVAELARRGTYRIILSAPEPWGTAETRLLIR